MDYISFDLRLGDWNPNTRAGRAEVLDCSAGECPAYPFELELDIDQSFGRVHRTPSAAAELGQRLTRSILKRDALTLWYESYQIARERGRGLRLRLHIDAWELTRLPWELLYDERRHEFIVFDPMISLVRYIRLQSVSPRLRQSRSIRILVVVASPSDQLALDWQHEVGVLQQGLRQLVENKQVELVVLEHATPEKLHTTLLELVPHVVHYIGHAEYDPREHRGVLTLEDDQGKRCLVEAGEIARILRRYRTNLVVLNACDTAQGSWAGLAPALVRAELPAVVAMQWPVDDDAAIRFSRAFYRALALGHSIDECMSEGRLGASMGSNDPNDWAAPVLFLRSLSGQLWTTHVNGRRTMRGGAAEEGQVASEPPTGFKTRGPLVCSTDADLISERKELDRALRIARQPAVTQYIAILSTRQTGKTTLLFRMMDKLHDLYLCVFIDLSVLRAEDAGACFHYVAFQLINELRVQFGDELLLPVAEQIEGATDFERFLGELAMMAPVPRIVLLFDEVGGLGHEASDTFFNTWRAIFHNGRKPASQQLSKYLCVFCGAVDLHQLTSGMNSPLNICEKIYLADLEPQAVERIVSYFERLGIPIAAKTADCVYELTSGHPYLTMRLCALAHEMHPQEITPETIAAATEKMLTDDDNITHIIRQLEENPQARRRMKSILDGHYYHFMRSDPLLAALEMIGAIATSQPCRVRNQLYERALRAYYANSAAQARLPTLASRTAGSRAEVEALYERLDALRRRAQDGRGRFRSGGAWKTFAAAFFSLVPAFSLYPSLQQDVAPSDILLTIADDLSVDDFWSAYKPSALVSCQDLKANGADEILRELCDRARRHQSRLVILIPSGPEGSAGQLESLTGRRQSVTFVLLDAVDTSMVITERQDLGALLCDKVMQARQRRI